MVGPRLGSDVTQCVRVDLLNQAVGGNWEDSSHGRFQLQYRICLHDIVFLQIYLI